jgi:putative hydrolase of HD superfamily
MITGKMIMKNTDQVLDLLLTANRLKITPRTGWAVRGITDFESVADHSHGVAFVSLLLCDLVPGEFDRAKVLTMAILHDLPESVTGDLSLGGSRLLPEGAKAGMESRAMDELISEQEFGTSWRQTWDEFEALDSPEAKLVRDADRIDLLTQALTYERAQGTVNLEEFWQFAPVGSFHFEESRQLIAGLRDRRPR